MKFDATIMKHAFEGRSVILYDGYCIFCTASAKRLQRWGRRDQIEIRSFQENGVLDEYPSISYQAAMKEMHVVSPEGVIYKGAEAVVRVLATRRIAGWLAYAYYLPGLHQLIDATYRTIAKNRYRILGRTGVVCDEGTCHLHTGEASDQEREPLRDRIEPG